jgi:AraC-like DNA-binding protein
MPSPDAATLTPPVGTATIPADGRAAGAWSVGDAFGIRSGHPAHALPLTVVQIGESEWRDGQRCQGPGGAIGIEFVLEGTLRLERDGHETLVAAGEVVVLKPTSAHTCQAVGGAVRRLRLVLDGPLAAHLVASLPERIAPGDNREVRAAFDEIARLVREPPADCHARASCIAYRLLVLLSTAPRDGRAPTLSPTVAAALRILETSGARDLDIRQVARAVGTSVSHLHRLFKDALGTSPLRYAREHLIAQAKDALGSTSLSCQEIAKRLGYDDPLYFSAVFKRITGVSPREFRKRNR